MLELCVNNSGPLELFSLCVSVGQRSRCWRGLFFEDFLFIGKGVLELCVNDSGPLELFSLGVSHW